MYLACIHFCIPCCIPFNVYFWCVLVRTHYNEYTKTIRIPQSLCIHDSIQSVRFKYTFPIRRLKYTISIQKYTFYRLVHGRIQRYVCARYAAEYTLSTHSQLVCTQVRNMRQLEMLTTLEMFAAAYSWWSNSLL